MQQKEVAVTPNSQNQGQPEYSTLSTPAPTVIPQFQFPNSFANQSRQTNPRQQQRAQFQQNQVQFAQYQNQPSWFRRGPFKRNMYDFSADYNLPFKEQKFPHQYQLSFHQNQFQQLPQRIAHGTVEPDHLSPFSKIRMRKRGVERWNNESVLKEMTLQVMQFLQGFEWKLQMRKYRIYPSTVYIYLGWDWSTQNMEVKMPRDRRHKMKKKLLEWNNTAHNHQTVKARDPASLIGALNFLKFQFVEASLILKSLNHLLAQAIKKGGCNYLVKLNKRNLGNLYSLLHKFKENNPKIINDISSTALLTIDVADIGQEQPYNLLDGI
ncbi:MAG: hypothetical protein EZS28_000889 [Streblomastix strix]|uniref:Uncharacterized protein n=1 Tax=Streblomastix strix TaxID=222440 RepID=A0A5J4X8S0_9EUKA|nr:MAG: hypothetical protein EZS28_000889 [Streblomastix strix]